MRIEPVPTNSMQRNWRLISQLLDNVMNKVDSGLDKSVVAEAIRYGDMQLWSVNHFQAIAVTEIQNLPLHKVLTIIFLSGKDMDEWLAPLIGLLSRFGKEHGCKYLEFYGRPGWEKKAPEVGFEKKYTVMAQRISDG